MKLYILSVIDHYANRYSIPQSKICSIINLAPRTIQRWRKSKCAEDQRKGPKVHPRKLSGEEERRILKVCLTEPFYNYSPLRIVPMLADKGIYIASESSFYRVLRRNNLLVHRGRAHKPRKGEKPNSVAIKPNQVWVWDITNLPKPCRKLHYKLYMFMDLYSRKIVGWDILDTESDMHSKNIFWKAVCDEKISGEGLTLHSDNGGPMRGHGMLSILEKLGVKASFSRPYLSTDNAYAESMFKTLKYCPMFPQRPFGSIEEAREWTAKFVHWYNNIHLHSGIGYVTPAQRHNGKAEEILSKRKKLYEMARTQNSKRWSKNTRQWKIDSLVGLIPQLTEQYRRHLY